MPDLSVGVGQSRLDDSFEAGKAAASQAMTNHGGTPEVLIVFGPPNYDHRKLLAGIVSVTGDIQMVGGTTAGEISTAGFATQSVVVTALSSDTLRFVTGIGKDMSMGERECCNSLLRDLKRKTNLDDAQTLFIFPNGIGGDGIKIIAALQDQLGKNFEIIGGYLGDDVKFKSTFQFFNGTVYKDAIPGLLMCGAGGYETGVGVRSGFESIGNRFYCTESDGNVVKKFDGEPALQLYKEFLGEDRSKRLPDVCLEYPFGLIDQKVSLSGKEFFQLRAGLLVDEAEGTITMGGAVPEGSALTLTTGSRADIINGARLAAQQAKQCLGEKRVHLVLMFSCVGRRHVLGRRTGEEVDAVKKVFGPDVPIAGFYTYGEFGPIDKVSAALCDTKFHNETVVIWALAGP